MTSTQVVETSVNVTTNSPSHDYTHPGDHNLPTYKNATFHLFSCPSFYPAVRTGSSNTLFFLSCSCSSSSSSFFFFLVTFPRPPIFVQPNKRSSQISAIRLGLVSWVTVIYFAPWGEGEQRRGLIPLGLFLLWECFANAFLCSLCSLFVSKVSLSPWFSSSSFASVKSF